MNKTVGGLRGRRLMEVLSWAHPASLDSAPAPADAITACLAAAADAPPARATRPPRSAPAQRGAAGLRRWPGWLAPVAAAAAVAAVIAASLAISGGIARRPAGAGAAVRGAAAVARVPRYFVALTNELPGPAAVGATATGKVLGTVAPPRSYPLFTMVSAARDGRTFVFAAERGLNSVTDRLYRLVLSRSGHPGRLTPLPIPPIPPQTGGISGLAVSPDGSKVAVAVLGSGHDPSRISVFSLATGAGRDWTWPGEGRVEWVVPVGVNEFAARSLSWQADNRTLLFQVYTGLNSRNAHGQARLLDTAAPAGSLLAASTPVPIPSAELAPWGKHPPVTLNTEPLLLTGDGTRIVATTYHPTGRFHSKLTISEFSVRTGKLVRVVYRQRSGIEPSGGSALWVNGSGTVMIASHGLGGYRAVVGVQTLTTFTPLPAGVQHYFRTGQPAW
jgi:hypothetical protein